MNTAKGTKEQVFFLFCKDEYLGDFIEKNLKKNGYQVVTFIDIEELIRVAREQVRPDCIIMNLGDTEVRQFLRVQELSQKIRISLRNLKMLFPDPLFF